MILLNMIDVSVVRAVKFLCVPYCPIVNVDDDC